MTEQGFAATGSPSSSYLTGRTVGRFVIGERLGKGGMGEVYRAEDTRLKRMVALKRLAPSLRSDPVYRHRFQEEAERASRFSDSHVAAIYDVIDEHEETLLVMEYVEGTTLRRRLKEPMSLDEFLKIAIQCAEALVAADRVGIVHCDIKPENIMLSTAGNVKILDFGVAKFLPRSDQSSTVDRSGTIGGTPAYMSPEVLLEKGADGRSDIFSLGLVLYEALAGHHPFLSDSYIATTHRILHEKATPIRVFNSSVPEELDRIVAQAMAKDPAERYAHAQELLDDLQAVQAGVTPSKLLPRPLIWRQRRSQAWIMAVAIIVIALAGSYGFYWWKHRPPPFQERGWALITDFDSTGEDPIPDKGVREGLTIALQQSPYVNVYPRTRIYEALQRMKRTDVSRIDESLGREICRRENIQVLLIGSVEHVGQAFQIAVRGENPSNGTLLFAEKDHFNRKEEIFDRVDSLARFVRRDLGESVRRIENTTRPLAKVTTSSLDALQLYTEASDYLAQGRVDPAPPLLQGALQLDAEFAMAHALLADVYEIEGNRGKELEHLEAAYRLRTGVSEREQRVIEAKYYDAHGEYEKAVQTLITLVSLFPDDVEAHTNLAREYSSVSDTQHAIEQIREVLRLDPNSAPAYSVLARYLARINANSEAIDVSRQAISRGLDSPALKWSIGLALLGQGDVAGAQEQFQRLERSGGAYGDIGRIYLARMSIYEGKLGIAGDQLRSEILLSQKEENKSPELLSRYLLANILMINHQFEAARQQLARVLASGEPGALEAVDLRRAGTLYAQMRDLVPARKVLQKLDLLRASVPTTFNQSCYHNLAGEIALAEGRPNVAVAMFTAAFTEYPLSISQIGIARAYSAQHDWSKAAVAWRQVLASKGEILQDFFPADWVLAHLELARTYKNLGDIEMAQREYQNFDALWSRGDNLPIRRDSVTESQLLKLFRPQ